MGTNDRARPASRPAGLADALFTTTQQRVLGLLFGQPERSYYATELMGLAGSGRGAVQRELARLEHGGLVTVKQVGNQKHYQADPRSALFDELRAIARKTFGLAEPIRRALAPLASKMHAAFVYGSVAKRQDTARSDIDLMIVSDKLSYADVYPLLEPLQYELGRTVNPTVLTRAAVRKAIKEGKAFVKRVWAQPKVWIIGDEHDLTA
jgi:predicted nucleotidyltransferase